MAHRSNVRRFLMLALAGIAPPALAHPFTLNVSSGSASITSASTTAPWVIHINVTAGSPCVFTLTTSDANTVLESVTVECDADCRMTIDESSTGTFAKVGDVLEATSSSPESFELQLISISGDLGSVVANEHVVAAEVIERIIVDGDLTAEIIAGPRASSGASDVELLEVGGDLLGDISADHGVIEVIDVSGGFLGGARLTCNGLQDFSCDSADGRIEVSGPLNRLSVAGNANLIVIALTLEEHASVVDPGLFVNGTYSGSLFVGDLSIPIEIGEEFFGDGLNHFFAVYGDVLVGDQTRGDITVHGDWSTIGFFYGEFETTIRIGGSLANAKSILVESLQGGGGAGQIIINALDDGGEWIGNVAVDSVTLSPIPHYTNTDLIGAVGEVPFHLHDGDCIPENGGTAVVNAFSVTLRFYGPVTSAAARPFNIWWRPATGGSWTLDNAQWSVSNDYGTRTVELLYADNTDPSVIPADREYLIEPILTGEDALLCDKLLTTEDVPVGDFAYTFFTP